MGRGRGKGAGETSLQNTTIMSRGKKYLEIFLLLIMPNVLPCINKDDDEGFSKEVEGASYFLTPRVRTSHMDIIPMLGLNKSNIFLDEQ